MKRTLVIGASLKPERYSNKAIKMLRESGIETFAYGRRAGTVEDVDIFTTASPIKNLDTITMYLGADNQKEHYDYFLSLKPKRIIFNPGAENAELSKLAIEKKIEVINACTLVMLRTNQY